MAHGYPAEQALKGFAIDITIAASKPVGIDVNYSNAPCERALIDVKAGKLDAVGPTFQEEVQGFVFPAHAISTTQYCFIPPIPLGNTEEWAVDLITL